MDFCLMSLTLTLCSLVFLNVKVENMVQNVGMLNSFPCGSLSLRILIPYIWPAYDHNRLVNLFRLLGCHFLLGFSASCYSLIHKYFKKKSDREDHAHLCALLFLLKCWPLQSWCLWTFLFAMLSFYFGGGRGKTVSSRQDDFSDKEFCHS